MIRNALIRLAGGAILIASSLALTTFVGHVPAAAAAPANAILPPSAFSSYSDLSYGPTDDGSWPCAVSGEGCTPQVFPFGFDVNFFGTRFGGAYINNNGNVTFTNYFSTFDPSALQTLGYPIIAPFFADVDTNSGPLVDIATGDLDGHAAFVVNWPGVYCYDAQAANTAQDFFQLVLIDRPDLGSDPALGDDFQIEFNYDSMQWDAGQASTGDANCTNASNPADSAVAGFSDGTALHTFELPGSQSDGALIDGGGDSLIGHDLNSDTAVSVPSSDVPVPGRYIFEVVDGEPGTPTSTSTSLSGAGQAGTRITVPPGAAVTDQATLSGDEIGASAGTVTYAVYADASCSGAPVASAGTVNNSNGVVPSSSAVTLTTPGTYYWQASYSGDNYNNQASTSGCYETETVAPTATPITVNVSGSQTFGGSPTFTQTNDAPSGVTLDTSGLSCSSAGGSALSTLAAGTFTLDGSSCSGASASGPGTYQITYVGVPNGFVVSPAQVTATVSGSETYGGTPSFSYVANGPAGLVSGTVSCTTAGGNGLATLVVGSYTLDGSSCNGLSLSDPTDYTLSYVGATKGFVVSPAPQQINFGPLATMVFGSGPFSVSATASSGLPVSLASGTPSVCTVSGSTVTLKQPGTCSITASQAGNANYLAATPVTQSFTVTSPCATGLMPYLLTASYGRFTFSGLFCVNAMGIGTYTQGSVSGIGSVATVKGTTYVVALGKNLVLTGQVTGTSSGFVELAPAPVKTGTFTLVS